MWSLAEISDRFEIQQLMVDYSTSIDRKQFDDLDKVFTADAYIDYRVTGGIDGRYPEVKAWLKDVLPNFPAYYHMLGNFDVRVDGDSIVVNNDRIKVVAERDPAKLPWKSLGVDVVLECTGLFTSKAKAGLHLQAGARKVIISAPGEKDVDRTVVFGVNHKTLKDTDTVISNASCTTSSSGERPWLASALATAERSTSSMSLATARFE